MSDTLTIESHKGTYQVFFEEDALDRLNNAPTADVHFLIDANIARLYGDRMSAILDAPSVLIIEATEEAKSLDRFPGYVEHLVANGIRRNHTLIAIGGGIIQDTTCFLAATLLRGVAWKLYPTTLLAQADSCIGSKSSINCGRAKNILGTFTPPNEVHISTGFLDTLEEHDVRSGVGEILKVHAIDGPDSFDRLAGDYSRLFTDKSVMVEYIRRALAIKIPYIQEDEFDRGPRNIFNYGHSFGHAIEAATNFAIPHGLAVTMGCDMANFTSAGLGIASKGHFDRMHPTLKANYRNYEELSVPLEPFLAALAKDKKNVGQGSVTLILPEADGRVAKTTQPADDRFTKICQDYFEAARTA